MGQATVDLPDPLETPPVDRHPELLLNAADLASADDLLSQLAGDDIDRLLAEAETAITQSPTVPPAAVSSELLVNETLRNAAVESEITATAGQQLAPSEILPETLPETLPVPVPTIEAKEAAALQAVLEAAAASAAELPAPTVGKSPAHSPIEPDADTHSVAAEEAAALMAPEAETPELAPSRPSAIVKFLQVLNSPMAWISDPLRDALGKISLLTLFNAVAVIAYVLLFRMKHPH